MAVASVPQPRQPAVIALAAPAGAGAPAAPVNPPVPSPNVTASANSRLSWPAWGISCGVAATLAGIAYWVAYEKLLPGCQRSTSACGVGETFRVSADFSVFAGLFVLALAVERFLDPLSRFIGPDTEDRKDKRDAAQADSEASPTDQAKAQTLATMQADVDKSRQIGSILHWGVAVAISFLLAGKLNVLLLAAIAAKDSATPAPWADLLVTGLVIGAGTKPLHDLVSGFEKTKEAKQDPKATGGGV